MQCFVYQMFFAQVGCYWYSNWFIRLLKILIQDSNIILFATILFLTCLMNFYFIFDLLLFTSLDHIIKSIFFFVTFHYLFYA